MSHAHSTQEHHSPHVEGLQTGSAAAKGQRRLAIVLGLTSAYLVAEVIGGLLTNSLALLADAGHMLTDVLGLAMALFAIRFAQRPATPAKTYGFYRTEILAALINGLVLFGIAVFILYEAWRRFQDPHEIASLPMLLVAVGGLVVNLIGVKLLHAGAGESLNLRGAFLEVLSDLLGSLGVILAAAIIYFTGWWPADPLISVVIGLFILPRSWRLLKSALDVLLEATPATVSVAEVEAAMRTLPGVVSIHELHVWTITSGFLVMTAHVAATGRRSSEVLRDVRALVLRRFGIEHATIQVERLERMEDEASCVLDPRCLIVGEPPAQVAP